MNYATNEIDPDYLIVTWKEPVDCNECKKVITDYDYYYYEKRNVDQAETIIKKYYCCVHCYLRLRPIKSFKVPYDKIVKKTLSQRDRRTLWINTRSG